MAKVGKLVAHIQMRRWAKCIVIACVLTHLPVPKWAFTVTVKPERV